MEQKHASQRRRSSQAADETVQISPQRSSAVTRHGSGFSSTLDPSSHALQPEAAPSFPEELDPSGQRPFLLPDPNMDHPLDGLEGEPDPFFAGHELYRALRGSQGDDPLNDELLWDGDFMTTQREFIQKKQEDEMLQRLERRMGRIRAAPTKKATQAGAEDASSVAGGSAANPPALAQLGMAAVTGVKLKNLLGRVIPSGPATAADGTSAGVSASGSATPAGRPLSSAYSSASAQLTPPRVSDSAGLALQDPAAAAAQSSTPRLFARLTSSMRRQSSQWGRSAATGPLGVLVAEENMKTPSDSASAGTAAAAGDAAGTAAGAAAEPAAVSLPAAPAGELQPADAVVQVIKVLPEKSLTPKELEAKEKERQEELQRMDTDARLQVEVDSYSWVRRTAVKICTHSDFELIVMLLIFGNCISLALYDPLQSEHSLHNDTLTKFDLGLNVAFTIEMVLRIISMGGIRAYLHHPWNAFDCVMVLAGYTTFIPMGGEDSAGLEGVKALRALRALRPLRTITRVAALRSIVVCFLEAVPLLVSVAAMLFFFLFIFAVAAAEIFGDAFHYGCTDPATGLMEQDTVAVEDEFSCGARSCPPEFSECREYEHSLARQIAGFENVGLSMLSVFQAMTLTNWSFTMYRTMDFLSPAVVVYWFVMIVFGAYFVLNLFLAVLKTKFAKAKNLLDEKRRQRRAMKASRGLKKHNVLAKAAGFLKSRVASYVSSRAEKDSLSAHVAGVVAKRTASEVCDFGTPRSNLTGFTEFIGAQQVSGDGQGAVSFAGAAPADTADASAANKPVLTRQLSRMNSGGSGMSGYSGYTGVTGMTGVSAVSTECLLTFEEFDESVQDVPKWKRVLLGAQYRVRVLVCSSWFNNFFLLAIILNTVALAIVYDGMTHEVEEALAIANFVFTGIFTLEMLLKLAGLGAWKYLSDPWSLFDAIVVAFSLVELVIELMARSSASGLSAMRSVRSLRVLRSFRVLRVMKMFKYLESLKMIAAVLISSMASFASIVILLVLFWLVFSIVGLHVFGGLKLDVAWPNCDSLINSLITSFNILNLENFQISMYSVIRATNYASSMYWLAWIVLGKFIFLTLFLAVTLDAFERKYEADIKRGVRSQSMASSMFSRIKKAGQKVKSLAASMAGSNSGKSTLSGIWRRGPSKTTGSMSGSHHKDSSHQGPMLAAGGGSSAHVLPGQPVPDAVAVVQLSAPSSGHGHGRRSSMEHSHNRRRSTEQEHSRRVSEEAGSGHHSSHQRHSHEQHREHSHHHHHHQQDRRLTADRRRSTDVRTASPPPQQDAAAVTPGPVAESAASLHTDYTSGWGTGMRLRRLRAGMQQHYGCSKLLSDTPGGGLTHDWGSSSFRHSTAAAEAGFRRSSSSSGGSGTNSFTLKQEAAAAFAAAAAADALRPCHVLPELLDDDVDELMVLPGVAGGHSAAQPELHWLLAQAMGFLSLQHSGTAASTSVGQGWRTLTGTEGKCPDPTSDYTWQEFLATVSAISYPSTLRVQQQQLLQQNMLPMCGSAAEVDCGAAPSSAASLGPIAEGLEDVEVAGSHSAPLPTVSTAAAVAAPARLSFNCDDGHVTARSLQLAADHPPLTQSARPSSPLAAAEGGRRSKSPTLRQLALDDIDKDLASLGLQPIGVEPATPSFTLGGGNLAGTASGGGSCPGLGASTDACANTHATKVLLSAPGSLMPQPQALPATATAAAGTEAAAAMTAAPAAVDHPAAAIAGAKPPKDGSRRVTLFTESMRNRGECPAPPRSPRFTERPSSSAMKQNPALLGGGLDALLDLAAVETEPGKPGSMPESAVGRSSTAALLALGSVEPAITAQVIRRRKAAAVSFSPEQGSLGASTAPQAIAESAGQSTSGEQGPSTAADAADGSEGQSLASSTRRTSRAFSDTGSEGGLSDGGQSYVSGDGSKSGAWSTFSGMGRSRSRTFPELAGVSLWVFPQENRFRQAIYDIVTHKYFDYFMFLLIMLNCVAMAYEYPAISKENLDGAILFWSDMVFTVFFTIEAVLKIIAFGFKPYMSFFQNQVDIAIVVSSLVMLFLESLGSLHVIKGLRVLRAIKPLRALTRSAGMQLIFKSLTYSLAAMGNVSVVVLLFFLIFAILGVQLFHGKFWSCNDTSVADKAACVGTFMLDGKETAREWSNLPYNFDNLGMGLMSLFVTATLNGYLEIMGAAMAAPEEPGLQPQPMSNWSAFFFFAAFVLVVAYTLLNLYIGVVFYQFSRIRMQSQTGSAFLTDEQTEWVEMSKLVFRLKPPEKSPVPVNKLRRKLYYLVQGKPFEYFIMTVIVANSALMATAFYGQPPEMTLVVEAINYGFTCIYVLEFVLKALGLGWQNYWKNMWNKFDFLLLITGLVDMFVTLLVGPGVASFLKIQKIMRLLRLARVVKLMRSMKGLRSLFGTLIVALPAFWNVGALLALMFFIYSYIGMLLLGNIKRNGGLNEHTNFERFWTAALTLFKVATNDNWTDVMVACLVGPPDCDPASDCGSWVAYPYFITFVVLVSIIMLQLFTAVIIESFEAQEEQDRWKLRPDHLEEFVELWAEYDDGSGTIDPKDLEAMLLRLSPPLGLGKGASSTDVLRFVFDLDIPLLNGRVPFQRTAYELVRRCSGAEIPEGMLKDQIDRLVTRAFRNLKADEVLNFSVAVTVMRVQRKWRARMRAAKMKRKKEFRADRGVAPLYADVVASRDTTMKEALRRRQAGDLRWRPHPACAQHWAAAEAVLAAEAAVAAYSRRRSSGSSSGMAAEVGPGGCWSSLAGFKASADGWMQRMTSSVTGGLQKIKGAGGLFRKDTDTMTEGGRSARSSLWGFGSKATSKAGSTAANSAAASTAATSAAASAVVSRATSRAISDVSSMAPSDLGSVDSAM